MYDKLKKHLLIHELAKKPDDKIASCGNVIKDNSAEKINDEDDNDGYRLVIDKNVYFLLYRYDKENENAFQFGVYSDFDIRSGYTGKNEKCVLEESESPFIADKKQAKFWIYSDTELSCPYIEGYKEMYETVINWLIELKHNDLLGEKAIKKLEYSLKKGYY